MTSTSLLSLGTSSRLLTESDLVVDKGKIRNITADVNDRLFPPIPTGDRVRQRHVCIVGKQDCGKTWLMNYILHLIYEKYGKQNANAVNCDDPRVFMDMLNDLPVQVGFIDDATSNASSREAYKQTEILKAYNKARHVFEKILKGKPGIIIWVFGWQRWIELDPGFRDGHFLLFKTGMTGWQDRKDIEDKLGEQYNRFLYQIWDQIERGNDRIKSLSVARIASKRPEDGGVGIYVSKEVPRCLPDMILSDDYYEAEAASIDVLDSYRDKPPWDKRIKIYEAWMSGNYATQTDLANALNIRQGRVSDAVAKVRELLKKK